MTSIPNERKDTGLIVTIFVALLIAVGAVVAVVTVAGQDEHPSAGTDPAIAAPTPDPAPEPAPEPTAGGSTSIEMEQSPGAESPDGVDTSSPPDGGPADNPRQRVRAR